MIRTSELRQGNKLLWSNYIQTVDAIGYGNYIQCDPMDRDTLIDEFEPIPLTPEILEKCGFWEHLDGGYYLPEDSDDRDNLMPKNGFILNDEMEYHYEDSYAKRSIKLTSLHQLQNLYWCLAGEELKINMNLSTQPSHS